MSADRLISLAAGVVQEFPPEQIVYAAAEAGFNATGIWCDPETWNAKRSNAVRNALSETGLCALDLEVVWLQPGEAPGKHDAMIAAAQELGVRNVLCVSSEPNITDSKKRFEHLCNRVGEGSLRVVLEFLAITEISSLQQALEVVQDVGHPAGGILVDTLHLQRTGSHPQDLIAIDPALMPYIQLCDASALPLDSSPQGLIEDALYLRELPGAGALPLHDVLAALDSQLPLSLEVRSRRLFEEYADDPVARARCVFESGRRLLEPGSLTS